MEIVSPTTIQCLVTIRRADVLSSRVVRCVLDGNIFLVIPVGDYAVPQAGGRCEMMLRAPEWWFVEVANADYEILCETVIDLDKFDELPWSDIPPPRAPGFRAV